jgi:putative nucleotidyltransferase with HDIG domain
VIGERIRQFREHHLAPGEAERRLAGHYLASPLTGAFFAQEPRDVLHSANTARWLLDRGHDDATLIQAALLHDIGKGAQRRRDRVVHVLLSAAHASHLAASGNSRFEVRRALARTATHAAAGAEQLALLGVEPRVVELVRRHHDPANGDAMLELLQLADAAT